MTQSERLSALNSYLLKEAPQYRAEAARFGADEESQFRLFRSLVNLRSPKAAPAAFLRAQDAFLRKMAADKGITDISELRPARDDLYIWRGDITALRADCIVNAANGALLGCFCPCHGCIDNAIHTFAGVRLRLACAELMKGREAEAGEAYVTPAFNLPGRYVIHTVGPIIAGEPSDRDRALLAACYQNCLTLADRISASSIAFCCISTGEYRYPNEEAAKIAVNTVIAYKRETKSKIKVIFNVFKEIDERIYRGLLGADRQAQRGD